MDLNSPKKVAFFFQHKNGNSLLTTKILADQIRLFYTQNSFGIIIHFLAAIFLAISLWNVTSHRLVLSWLFYMFVIYTAWYITTYYYRQNQNLVTKYTWFLLLAFFAFFAGIGWGISGSVLIPVNNLLHQTFVLIILFAITAGSILFFFQLHSFMPFSFSSHPPFYYLVIYARRGIYSFRVVWTYLCTHYFCLLLLCE